MLENQAEIDRRSRVVRKRILVGNEHELVCSFLFPAASISFVSASTNCRRNRWVIRVLPVAVGAL
jgi:hypothetical protein